MPLYQDSFLCYGWWIILLQHVHIKWAIKYNVHEIILFPYPIPVTEILSYQPYVRSEYDIYIYMDHVAWWPLLGLFTILVPCYQVTSLQPICRSDLIQREHLVIIVSVLAAWATFPDAYALCASIYYTYVDGFVQRYCTIVKHTGYTRPMIYHFLYWEKKKRTFLTV